MIHAKFCYCCNRWSIEDVGSIKRSSLLALGISRGSEDSCLPATESFADEEVSTLRDSVVDGG